MAHKTTTPKLGNITTGQVPTLPPAQTKFGTILAMRAKRPPQTAADSLCPIARQLAIENALSMALWHVRHGTGTTSMQAAIGRAMRAASMLKHACTEATTSGRA